MLLVNLWPSHHYNWESFDCLAKMKLTRINCKAIKTQVMINEKRIFPFSYICLIFFGKCLFQKQFPQISLLECVFLNILTFFAHSTQSIQPLPNSIKVLWIFPLSSFCNSLFYHCSTLRTHWLWNQLGIEGFKVKNQVKTSLQKREEFFWKDCETTSLVVLTGQWQHCNTKWKSRVLQMKKWR